MSLKGKLPKVFLLAALLFVPMTHKEIEEILRAMNQTAVEVTVPERNGEDETK